ncbi:DnaJ family molecular chaperone [Sphingomonas floccifaciens]|uniref:DnaJ family molecular chaperone n=1 Tax=Sphingomonas floccifaciens TaxID=1844115 RepID=A0ABW4NIK5_9SPHN
MRNAFEILGLQPDAEPEVVDAAYRALMKKYHPDRAGGVEAERAQAINAAYSAIKGDRAVITPPADRMTERVSPDVATHRPFRPTRNLLIAIAASTIIIAVMAGVATS